MGTTLRLVWLLAKGGEFGGAGQPLALGESTRTHPAVSSRRSFPLAVMATDHFAADLYTGWYVSKGHRRPRDGSIARGPGNLAGPLATVG